MNDKNLTIILTLRGRHLHTLRWLYHANINRIPYHIIIADGDVTPTIDRLLSDPSTFPNLSYEYHRHNDLSLSDFYDKLLITVNRVKTEYVMMADNDDFLITVGIQKSISFLNTAPDFVCAGGQLTDFTITPEKKLPYNVVGNFKGARFGYKYDCRDISVSSRADRVMEEIKNYQIIHYHVYRTTALQIIFRELKKLNFSDLTIYEYYIALRAVTLGKIRNDPSVVCYFRQIGTSMLSTYYKDWVHNLLRSRLPQDCRAMAESISNVVCNDEGINAEDFKEMFLDAYGD
jgi:glycosyltransferase domain-containing protein